MGTITPQSASRPTNGRLLRSVRVMRPSYYRAARANRVTLHPGIWPIAIGAPTLFFSGRIRSTALSPRSNATVSLKAVPKMTQNFYGESKSTVCSNSRTKLPVFISRDLDNEKNFNGGFESTFRSDSRAQLPVVRITQTRLCK